MVKGGACKWCAQGECWTHGQIAKPAEHVKKAGKGGKGKTQGGGGGGGGGWQQGLQEQLLQAAKQLMKGGGGQALAGLGAGAAAGPDQTNWKGELQAAYGRANKKVIEKTDIVYETSEVSDGSIKGFQAQVTLNGATFAGEVGESKRKAEHEAAKIALQELFPEHGVKAGGVADLISTLLGKATGKGVGALAAAATGAAAQGQKRKATAAAGATEELNPKSRLVNLLSVMLKRPLAKADTDFQVADTGDGQFTCTLTIPHTGGVFAGEAQPNKKAAEVAAARAALVALQAEGEAAMEEHRAAKKAKNAAQLAAMKERKEAKKAEAAAA